MSARRSRPPVALVAHAQEWSGRSLETILGPCGYEILRAHTGRQALSLARTANPDLIILDFRLPDFDASELCTALRGDSGVGASTPVIIITSGEATRAQRLAALRAGAWDLCTQPIDGEALLLKLQSFLDARRETAQIVEESLLDNGTGLYNGRGLRRRAREVGAEAQRRRQSVACVAFSVELGDEGGAPTGEQTAMIARSLAALCKRSGRASDIMGRVGPLEFVIIATGTGGDGASRLIERMRGVVEREPFSSGGVERTVRLRAGYYAVPDFASSTLDVEEILDRASAALRELGATSTGAFVRSFDDAPVSR